MALLVVVPVLSAPKVMVLPSTMIDSLAPSCKPLTLKVKPVMVCPASNGSVAALPNTLTAEACVA